MEGSVCYPCLQLQFNQKDNLVKERSVKQKVDFCESFPLPRHFKGDAKLYWEADVVRRGGRGTSPSAPRPQLSVGSPSSQSTNPGTQAAWGGRCWKCGGPIDAMQLAKARDLELGSYFQDEIEMIGFTVYSVHWYTTLKENM